MNGNTGQLYPSMDLALADLKPHEKPEDIFKVVGTPEAVERLSRTVQQMRAIEKERSQQGRPEVATGEPMMNPLYHFSRVRELLDEFEPSRERSLAATKIDEAEMWLSRCTPTQEARDRDQSNG